MNGVITLSMTQLLGIFAAFSSIVLLAGALYSRRENSHWWFLLESGISQFVIAILLLATVGKNSFRLTLLIGVCSIVMGISAFLVSLRIRQELIDESSLLVIGIVCVLFGCWMVFSPGETLPDRKWHVAAYLVLSGLATLYLSYKLWQPEKDMNMV